MRAVIVLLTLAVSVCRFFTATGIDFEVRLYTCDPGSHDHTSNAEEASNRVLHYVCESAADSGYNVQQHATVGYDTYYGHGACDGRITWEDCDTCVEEAHTAVLQLCDGRNGAWVKLDSCRILYADHPFDPNY